MQNSNQQVINNTPARVSSFSDTKKLILLVLGIIFDLIGMATFLFPVIGETFDIIWAPISAVLMIAMYRGSTGVIGGVFSFLEEILPGTDFIPSFTIMWFYTYVIKNNDEK